MTIFVFIFFEACFFYLILIVLNSLQKRLIENLALALVLNIFLSECSLICIGLIAGINYWIYLFLKIVFILLIFAIVRDRYRIRLKNEHVELKEKINNCLKSPLNLFVIFFFIILFLNSLGNYPVVWDSLSYHLPLAANFLKNGILSHYQYYGVSIGSYYPHTIELLYSLFFSLNGIESSSFINFPSIVLLFLAIYLLAYHILKIKKEFSILGALTFILFPINERYFYEAYVDIYFLSFCLLGLYFLFQLYISQKKGHLLFLFLLISLLIGTKYQGLIYSLYIGLFIFIYFLKYKLWKILNWRFIFSIVFLLLTGSFFYFRNTYFTGNPIFPLNINFLGIIKFPGHYNTNILSSENSIFFSFPRIAHGILHTLFEDLSIGLILFIIFWISPLLSLKKTRPKIANNTNLKIIIVASTFLFINFLFTPYSGLNTAGGFNFSLRLGLVFLTLLYLASLALFCSSNFRYQALVLCSSIICLFASGKFLSLHSLLVASLVLLSFLILVRSRKFKPGYFSFLFITLIIILILRPPIKKWENYFSDVKHYKKINIAYAGTNTHFQLYDKYLAYNIFYINVDRTQNLKWNKEKDLSFHKQKGNFSIWIKNIQKEDIDYFVLYERSSDYIENSLIKEKPDIFQEEIQNVFNVNKNKVKNYLLNERGGHSLHPQ